MRKSLVLTSIILGVGAARAGAEVRLEGSFEARDACEAYQSIRNETNPGWIRTEPGTIYPLVAKNKPEATHYLIEIAGAQPQRRWVAIRCGDVNTTPTSAGGSPAGAPAEFLLVASWEPAFCESDAGQRKTECTLQSDQGFDATNFSLHGLWPQPNGTFYCRVPPELKAADTSNRWDDLPSPDLTASTRAELDRIMPGTRSNLDRHEWIKHGTCFGGEPPEGYFARAIALMEQLNASRVRELFAGNIGSEVTGDEIRRAFDESFGPGAGERVLVSCKNDHGRRLITELQIGLVGTIGDQPSLGQLIAASVPHEIGCPRGIVDRVGHQ